MSDLKSIIAARINAIGPGQVWLPTDFAQLGNRDAIDKVLQRMALAGDLRRIDRGLYDKPVLNRLTKRATAPDYRAVLAAIARRDQLRMLVDGMTAANDLGLTDAVPARVTIAEYINVAHAFFGGEEPGFINGVLDGLSRNRRPDEF